MLPVDRRNTATTERQLRMLLRISAETMRRVAAEEFSGSASPGLQEMRDLIPILIAELAPKRRTRR